MPLRYSARMHPYDIRSHCIVFCSLASRTVLSSWTIPEATLGEHITSSTPPPPGPPSPSNPPRPAPPCPALLRLCLPRLRSRRLKFNSPPHTIIGSSAVHVHTLDPESIRTSFDGGHISPYLTKVKCAWSGPSASPILLSSSQMTLQHGFKGTRIL
jgi:hypothetical protein